MGQDPLACTTLLALGGGQKILEVEDAGGAKLSVRGKTRCSPAEMAFDMVVYKIWERAVP